MDGFQFDSKKEISYCEACTEGKLHKSPYPSASSRRAEYVLDSVHSDICGKLSPKSAGGAECFVTIMTKAGTCGFMCRNPRAKCSLSFEIGKQWWSSLQVRI